MQRALRVWAAVSSWLIPLAILVIGVIDIAENGSLSSEGGKASFPGPVWVHLVFLLLVTVPLYWRKRWPLAVVLIVSASCVTWILSMFNWAEQPPLEPALSVVVAVFTLASLAEGWQLAVGTATSGALLTFAELLDGVAGQGVGNVLPAMVLFAATWTMGRIVHQHRGRASREQLRANELEELQELRAREAAERERARIARELHDVVAHSLSLIVVQAAGERRVLAGAPQSTGEVLESIEHTGRQAMAELRRLLGVLRKDGEQPSFSPQPGLRLLPELAAEVSESGLEVRLATEGDATRIPPGLDLSAYRIVQECLTNVLKHAHASRADVHVLCGRRSVEIEVTDNGEGADTAAVSAGFGLIGMRERVAVYGGEVRAGRLPEGGYCVQAVLPFDSAELALQ